LSGYVLGDLKLKLGIMAKTPVTAITLWEGTPAALILLAEGSKNAAKEHIKLGAKNPRLLEPITGGNPLQRHYVLDFDSMEDYAAFISKVHGTEWWTTMQKTVADAYPHLRGISQSVVFNSIG